MSSKTCMDQEKRRKFLLKQLGSLQYLACQGLTIRGHHDGDGNLSQLLKCRADDITGIQQWIDSGNYQSHDIVNEMIQLLKQPLNKIRSAEWYSIIVDETRDASGVEQLGISIRWVESDYVVHEDVIGLVEVEATDAATLCSTIKDILLRVNLQLAQCRGQAYDGAANMAGHISGLATRLKAEEHRMLHVHCMAHCLNLCLQDCSRNCSCVRDALDLTSELSSLIHASPKRLALFQNLKSELNYATPGLKPLCPTRWTVRTAALDAVIKNYTVICTALEQISKECCGEPSRKASGLISLMEKFSTFYGLKLSFLVFSATEQLSRTLQSSSINAQEASMASSGTKHFLIRQRTESSFDHFYRTVVEEAKDLTMPPTLPRKRYTSVRINDGAPNHNFSTPEEYFRKQYYEILDLLTNELDRRFEQESFQILQQIEDLLIKSCNGITVQPSEKLLRLYAEDVNFDNLKIQLKMLPDLLHTANEKHNLGKLHLLTQYVKFLILPTMI